MNCYKCGTDKDLSIKKHDRHNNPIHICRSCRRAQYRHQMDVLGKQPRVFKPKPKTCYLCKTTKDLIEKEGWRKDRMVCRTCNRASKTEQIRHNPFQPHYACGEDWLQKARESQERILRKYAS